MKLLQLKLLDDFRSLKNGFEVDFSTITEDDSFDPYCIVGRNGSGKSNILELLSQIFYQLELITLQFLPQYEKHNGDEIVLQEYEAFSDFGVSPDAYILIYKIKNTIIEIQKDKQKPPKGYILTSDLKEELSALELKEYLPENIVGYSSGTNEILSLPFLKMRMLQYDEYLDYLSKDIFYSSSESRMVYLDDVYAQAIFITNFLDIDNSLKERGLLDIFKETLGIENIQEFRMVINTDIEVAIYQEDEYGYYKDYKNLFDGVKSKIDTLKRCSTLYYEDKENQKLYLDFYLDDACKEVFRKNFDNSRELFDLFKILIGLNYYHISDYTKNKLYNSTSLFAKGYLTQPPWNETFFQFRDFLIKKNNSEKLILSRSLSDGEHQFLHTIGLALLYKNTPSLFLLDEPETHFNPAWRAKYISTLKKCFKDDSVSPEVFITSHSPFIVSDSKPENVLIFEKDTQNKVECKRPDFNTFGASINKITIKVFEKSETIGDMAKAKLEEFKQRLETEEDIDKLIKEVEYTLGDSVEKILLLKELFDKQEGK